MNRLIDEIVFRGFVTCWRRAGAPTSRWPSFVNATTDGVVRPPSAFGITVGSPPSSTAMQLFVVPRSIPIVFAMLLSPFVASSQIRKSKCENSRYENRPRERGEIGRATEWSARFNLSMTRALLVAAAAAAVLAAAATPAPAPVAHVASVALDGSDLRVLSGSE